ncbi:MAG TPA: nuclear transport factor 2 family protein [Thermoleophilaceae bacterium]|jgi:ketosteroid isomerase-like protein
MTDANVELVRESARRFAAGDLPGLAGLCTPDVVVMAPPGWPDGRRFEGRDAVIKEMARAQEDWGHQKLDVLRERGERDWVVCELLWSVEGAGSGLPGQVSVFAACRVEGSQIAEFRYFWDWDDAIAAAAPPRS